jgi:hypothetical protein
MNSSFYIPVIIPIIIEIRLRRIIMKFKESGTTTFNLAKTLNELGIFRGFLFNRLLSKNVIIDAGSERYFLNEDNYIIFRKNRRVRIILIILFLLSIIAIIDFISSNHHW